MALTAVSVVSPKQTAPAQEIILPGNVQPFITSPIYSRTNGYLKTWYVDIGAHVKQGQLLAVIETPEVDQQLEQSLSNLNTAKANLALAEITKNRYEGLLKTHAVSQQDVDNAVGTYNANKAIVEANQANVKQLQALQSFEKIYAPFDGVVTARNTDIGDLINSGSSGGVKTDLFHIAQPGTLRVYVNVPEEYSQGVKVGMTADLSSRRISRTQISRKAGPHCRRHQCDNPHLADRNRCGQSLGHAAHGLLCRGPLEGPDAGLDLPASGQYSAIPLGRFAGRHRQRRESRAHSRDSGARFRDQIEIVAGLKANDQVIVNPPDSIISGQQVQIVQATLPGDVK